jgi:hypothetical protein
MAFIHKNEEITLCSEIFREGSGDVLDVEVIVLFIAADEFMDQ